MSATNKQFPTIMLNNACYQQTMSDNHAEQCLSSTNNVQQSCWTMSVTNKQCPTIMLNNICHQQWPTIMLNNVCHQQTMSNNHAEKCLSPTNNDQQSCWTRSVTNKQCPTNMLNNYTTIVTNTQYCPMCINIYKQNKLSTNLTKTTMPTD